MASEGPPKRRIRGQTYAIFFFLFAAILLLGHLPLLGLNYFWDELEQTIPSALDVFHSGALIPYSASPIIHPPGILLYLAAFWKLAGYHPATTRSAMLLLSAVGLLAAFLLSIELSKDNSRGAPAFLAVGLLICSPLFFAQSLLANLDAPAMVFTALALLLFLQNRMALCAAACVLLVLMKETGIIVPLVFCGWLAWERRWREAMWFWAPGAVLGIWLICLFRVTGYWMGSPGFEQYNFYFPLHPVRLLVAFSRRFYSLFFASFQWIGTISIVYAWRTTRIFHQRAWKIAWSVACAHVVLVTLLGGAVLTRYLVPVLPILFAAAAIGLSQFPKGLQLTASAALMTGLMLSNFINPPYPFPYEDNLAFADFVRLQTSGAAFLNRWFADAKITTAWPLTRELSRPELGYVNRKMEVQTLRNLTPQTLTPLDWQNVDVFVGFSRTWDPPFSYTHFAPVRRFWQKFYGFSPNSTRDALRNRVPFPLLAHFESRGQWLDIYVNPRTPLSSPTVRAAR